MYLSTHKSGTLAKIDSTYLVMESSGFSNDKVVSHSLNDTLKNIKNGHGNLKYLFSPRSRCLQRLKSTGPSSWAHHDQEGLYLEASEATVKVVSIVKRSRTISALGSLTNAVTNRRNFRSLSRFAILSN